MLENVRILSLTNYWAGPLATRLLADLGADVIKIEATSRPDPTRGPKEGAAQRRQYPSDEVGADPWNRVPRFNDRHLGTRSLTLDLTTEAGRQICLDLVRQTDAVVENFSARVLMKMGLAYDALKAVKPDIVLVSMPGFGTGGPWEHFVSLGNTLEHISGLASLTGHDAAEARLSGVMAPDYVGAVHGAAAILAGLYQRQRTGLGQRIELAQLESALCIVGEKLVETQRTGRAPVPHGNRSSESAPHGCYPCKEPGTWVAICVESQDEWGAFCPAAGLSKLRDDARFSTAESRKASEDSLDDEIAAWTATQDRYWITHQLQSAGVAAAPVLSPRDHFADPQVRARGMLVDVDHPSAGVRAHLANPWKGIASSTLAPAPLLGEHNDEVLQGILGMDPQAVDQLVRNGIVGTEPS